jgi:hypothetical protein
MTTKTMVNGSLPVYTNRRYIHELALSLNVALVVVWSKSATSIRWNLFDQAKNLFPPHYRGSDNYSAGFPAFFLLVILLASLFFLSLRLFAKVSLVGRLLVSLGGLLAMLSLPAGWFYVRTELGRSPFRPSTVWFILECGCVISCIVLYLCRKWSVRARGTALLITIHYFGWGWVMHQLFVGNPLGPVFPAMGLLSGLAWASYANQRTPHHSKASFRKLPAQT